MSPHGGQSDRRDVVHRDGTWHDHADPDECSDSPVIEARPKLSRSRRLKLLPPIRRSNTTRQLQVMSADDDALPRQEFDWLARLRPRDNPDDG
jgi:hypothetical protein